MVGETDLADDGPGGCRVSRSGPLRREVTALARDDGTGGCTAAETKWYTSNTSGTGDNTGTLIEGDLPST
jgi:hypothetical protein